MSIGKVQAVHHAHSKGTRCPRLGTSLGYELSGTSCPITGGRGGGAGVSLTKSVAFRVESAAAVRGIHPTFECLIVNLQVACTRALSKFHQVCIYQLRLSTPIHCPRSEFPRSELPQNGGTLGARYLLFLFCEDYQ